MEITPVINKDKPHLGGNILGGDPGTYCPAIWDYLIDTFQPKSIFDVGCGEGHLINYFYDKGIKVRASEGLSENINNARLKSCIIEHDYTQDVLKPIKVDMTISCEFVEHVEERFIQNYLPQFCACKILVFTHALPNQDGHHHVNCQKAEYWITLMSYFGFKFMFEESKTARSLTTQPLWKTVLIFKK